MYDFRDTEMMNGLRPSIEEAQPVQSQELALDYIGEWTGAKATSQGPLLVGAEADREERRCRWTLAARSRAHLGQQPACVTWWRLFWQL